MSRIASVKRSIFLCPRCNNSFGTRQEMRIHYPTCPYKGERGFFCKECEIRFVQVTRGRHENSYSHQVNKRRMHHPKKSGRPLGRKNK